MINIRQVVGGMFRGLSLSLPSAYGVATYPAGATFGPRRMCDYEFVWMVEGDAEYRWDETKVFAPEGSVVLCRPGTTDYFRFDPDRRTRHCFFHFNIGSYPETWPDRSEWPLVRLPVEDDILRPLFRHLLTWVGTGEPMQCELTMMQMLTVYVTGQVAAADVSQELLPESVATAFQYIHDQLETRPQKSISLTDLAEHSGVTPEHLCRLFRYSTGRTPMETVRLAKLDRAAVLLARSNYTINEIADSLGFSSQFHFSRRFKEVYGLAPSDLRKTVQAGATPPTPRLLRVSR